MIIVRNLTIIVKNRLIYGGNDTKDLIFNYGPRFKIGRNFYDRRNFCPRNFENFRGVSGGLWKWLYNFHMGIFFMGWVSKFFKNCYIFFFITPCMEPKKKGDPYFENCTKTFINLKKNKEILTKS